MFRGIRLSHAPLYLLCFAAGAGSTWYLTRPTSQATRQQNAASAPQAVRPVSWFTSHRIELAQKIAACSDNPGGAMADPECENAATAKEHIDVQEFLAGAPK